MNPSDLHDAFEQLSGRAPVPSEADTDRLLTGVRSHERRHRIAVRLAMSGVVAVVLVVAGIAALNQRPDGRTHVAGGERFGTQPAAVAGPAADAWARGSWGDLPKPPVAFGADSRAYWVGGRLVVVQPRVGVDNMTPSAWVGATFDPRTGFWTALPATPRLGQQANVATAGDRLLLWGGVTTKANGSDLIVDAVSVAVSLDPSSSTWRVIAPPPPAATSTAISTWTGTRLAIVGHAPQQVGFRMVSYDPTADTWSVGNSVPDEKQASASSILWTGTDLLVWFDFIPGGDGTGWQHLERYEPSRDRWSRVGGDDARVAVTDVALVDGKVVGREVATPCAMCTAASRGRVVTIDPATGNTSVGSDAPTAYVPTIGRLRGNGPTDPGSRQIVIGGVPVRIALVPDPKQPTTPGPGSVPMTVAAYDSAGHRWIDGVRPAPQQRPIVRDDEGAFTGSPQLVWTGTSLIVWGPFDCDDTLDCTPRARGVVYTPGR
jgi:hypothetical protein